MRASTFNCVKDILKDYPNIPKYIKEREIELREPYRQEDINAGIKGTNATYETGDNVLITIDQDRRLTQLKHQHDLIKQLLEETDTDTKVIIEELYIRKRPKYTMQGLVDNHLIICSRRTASTLRTKFFIDMAIELNLPI